MSPLKPQRITFTIFFLLSFLSIYSLSSSSSTSSDSNLPVPATNSPSQSIHNNKNERSSSNGRINPLKSYSPKSQRSLDSIRDFRFNAPPSSSSSNGSNGNNKIIIGKDSNTLVPASNSKDTILDEEGGERIGAREGSINNKAEKLVYSDPTIDDLTLLPLVIAVTVDGHVHALKRDSGQWLWTLHDDGGVGLGGTSKSGFGGSSRLKEEAERRMKAGGPVGGPLVKGVGRKRGKKVASVVRNTTTSSRFSYDDGSRSTSNDTSLRLGKEVPEVEEEEEEVYIIEPHSQGDIYLYTRSASPSSPVGSLQKLPLSMQQLVALSPFTFPSDSSRMFVGRKETKLVGVDLKTGRLVGVFGSGAGWCEWDEEFNMGGSSKGGEECDEEIESRPEDLLYMARTEYHLSIYSKASSSLLQTLTYTTYSSSSLGSALQSQWTRTPDSRYLQPMHDGALVSFLSGVAGAEWTIAFEVPVVSIFDVAIPTSGIDGINGESAQPLMFQQPNPAQHDGFAFERLSTLPDSTYIGTIDGEFFAMSKEKYPLVSFAPLNSLEMSAMVESITGNDESRVPCSGAVCLLGRHEVMPSLITPVDNTIDPPVSLLGIEAPPSSQVDEAPPAPTPASTKISPYAPNRSSVLTSIYAPVSKLSETNSTLLVVFLLGIMGYLYARKFWNLKIEAKPKANLAPVTIPLQPTPTSSSDTSMMKEVAPPAQLIDVILPLLPPSPPLISPPGIPTPIIHTPELTSLPAVVDPSITSTTLSPSLVPLLPSPDLTSTPRSRSNSGTFSPLIPISKELPPLPIVDEGIQGDENDESGDEVKGENGEVGTPRRKGRRRRGKKTKKGAAAKLIEELSLDNDITDKELGSITLGEAEIKEDLSPEVEISVVNVVDPHLIGGLKVSETILGYGSHGTVVLKGEFQGRAVAVKRLLKDFVTIATHEVALLQESDDHPHVIRYFCKEQRDTFLYIALELCPASLYDLIDQPSAYPDLVKDLDPKKALRQITSGIRHLHKLKIVHRDIKPQNILVSTSKHGGVRMLISDFGLCKKLDMDESSFQQTMNHAAGSFGYRAPEVLRGFIDPNSGDSGTPSNSTLDSRHGRGTSSSGSIITTDPSMRLTRSLDIFSLGCIFYYVLTRGEHPFGGRYEREMNILKGNLCLDKLDGLGEEALEVQDLITRMVATDPRERPSADSVLLHPFFWNAQKRLLFICDASDRFEIMDRDPPTPTLVSLEERASFVVGEDWQKSIDRFLLDNLGKYRKYDGKSVRDLLRVLRNKKHHYQDLPDPVRNHLGDLPGGFLSYFTLRFPHLLLHVYDVVALHLSDEAMFSSTFNIPEDEQ